MADSLRHALGFIAESVYGTTPATPAFQLLRNTGCTLAITKDGVLSEEAHSDRQIRELRHGNRQCGGEISGELSYGTYDDLLQAVLGGTWTSDVLKAGTERRSFSMIRQFQDLATKDNHLFTGCELNSWSLSASSGQIIKTGFGIVGQDMAISDDPPAGSTFPVVTTTNVFDTFTGVLKENNTTIAVVTEISLALDNGLNPLFVIGSDKTILPSISKSNLTGSMTVFFQDATLLEKFLDETASDIELTLIDPAGNSYEILLPNIKYTGGQPDTASEGEITLTMPFQALYDATEATNIKITRASA